MTLTQPGDDAAYLAWLAANPDGYVINTEPSAHGYARLHRATCGTIRYRPPFVGPSYIKICATSLREADEWAVQRRGAPAEHCRSVHCWP